MIRAVVDFALDNRFIVLGIAVLLLIWGGISFHNLPVGLLPAAMSRGIGSDSQRPFAIVIVGGLLAALVLSIYLLPTLYTTFARDTDRLPPADPEWEEAA